MSNTLTGLIPTIYEALDIVAREMSGFINAVQRNSSAARAAVGQTIRVPIVPQGSLADNTPAVTAPNTGDQTIGYVDMTISKSKHYPIRWTGEETVGLQTAGTYETITRDRFVQGMRTIVNAMEADIGSLYPKASRAFGSAGTAPFGTANDLSNIAGVLRILEENGAPLSDLHLVLGPAAMANVRGLQSVLFKVNEAGTSDLLRQGIIGQLQGFNLHQSAQVATHTKGSAAATFDVDLLAGYGIGDTAIHLDTGTGDWVAGDLFVAAGDANKYIIKTGATGGSDIDIALAAPGLRQTLADGVSIDAPANYTANLAFARSAIQLITRAPALPAMGDAADDRTMIQDPLTGLAFEVAVYKQFKQVHIEIGAAWGYECVKPEFLAIALG